MQEKSDEKEHQLQEKPDNEKEHQVGERADSEKEHQLGEKPGDENGHLKEIPESPALLQQKSYNSKWP